VGDTLLLSGRQITFIAEYMRSRRLWCVIWLSACELVAEPGEATGSVAVERVAAPVGVEPDDVDRGGGEGVLEADLGWVRCFLSDGWVVAAVTPRG